jgi:3-methyladenine DNA glycosylase AlkD
MKITDITKAIHHDLSFYASDERREKVAINHPTSLQVFGLMVAELRTVIAKWQKALAHYTESQWIELALGLVDLQNLECQLVAYELLWKNKKALQTLTADQVLALGKYLDNWVSVDMYCLSITGYCWQKGILADEIIEQWAKHPDRWIRRSALVSTVPLNLRARGGKGDVKRTLRICSLLVSDREDMVIKAISWALRELSKTDKKAVEQFMEENKDQIHSRVKREVETKLLTGKKNVRQNA